MWILAVVYAVGVGGILSAYREYFLLLTPMNLLFTLIIALSLESLRSNRKWWNFCTLAWLTGFFIEVAGVHTGVIFGKYWYGATLGFKVWDVPLMIGVNWLLLSYGAGETARIFKSLTIIPRSLLAAGIMVVLDILIEPVAMQLDFWDWEDSVVPLRNYIAWYIVAAFLAFFYQRLPERPVNQVAVFALILQFLFFIILNTTL
jgi:putative membrane protein